VAAASAIRVRVLEIFVNPHKFAPNSIKIRGFYNLVKFIFSGAGVLGPPVWEPGPKILEGPAGAPKTAQPAPCRPPFWRRRWRCSKGVCQFGSRLTAHWTSLF
jgi:hypothetical protein